MSTHFGDHTWRVVPTTPLTQPGEPRITLVCATPHSARLQCNTAVLRALNGPGRVELLLSGRGLALRIANPGSAHARRMDPRGKVTVSQLVAVLRLEPGDRWAMAATIEDGHVWCELPDEVVFRARREGRDVA